MNERSAETALDLAAVELFSDCSAEELARVEQLASRLDAETGQVLCREGEIGREFFVILDGTCDVTIDGSVVAQLGAGSGFGEIALVSAYDRRTATVTARAPMQLLVLDRDEFTSALVDLPGFARALLRETATRLAEVERVAGSGRRLQARP